MKKILILSALTLGLLSVKPADAQIRVGVHVNLGGPVYVPAPPPPPAPEPVVYEDDYYYLPEVEAYYSVPQHCYYYYDGYAWVSGATLPGYYRNYNWQTARRFAVHANRPYLRHDSYRVRYGGYSSRPDYYARAFPNRGNRFESRPQRNDNRGDWNRNRMNNDYNGNRQNGYNQGGRGSYQNGYGQPQYNRDDNRNDRGNRGDNNNGRDRNNYGGSERFAGNRPGRF